MSNGKKFKWNPECLKPSQETIDFGRELDPNGPFILRELSRTDLLSFIETSIEKKFLKEDGEREPFMTVVKDQEPMINKYLSLATSYGEESNKRSEEFFAKLDIPTHAYGDIIELFFEINHLDEILATGGNWLMLPTVREIQKQTEAIENE